MKSEHYKRVEEFMKLAGQPTPSEPTEPSEETRLLRAKLIFEEALETITEGLGVVVRLRVGLVYEQIAGGVLSFAVEHPYNEIETIDGCLDVAVVTTGTLVAIGVPDEGLQALVDENNLVKFGPGGYRREDGKWVKPPGHKPPAIAEWLEVYREHLRRMKEASTIRPELTPAQRDDLIKTRQRDTLRSILNSGKGTPQEEEYDTAKYLRTESIEKCDLSKATFPKPDCKICEGTGQVGGGDASLNSPACPECYKPIRLANTQPDGSLLPAVIDDSTSGGLESSPAIFDENMRSYYTEPISKEAFDEAVRREVIYPDGRWRPYSKRSEAGKRGLAASILEEAKSKVDEPGPMGEQAGPDIAEELRTASYFISGQGMDTATMLLQAANDIDRLRKRWQRVEIVTGPGYECGVICDVGRLEIAVRKVGDPWGCPAEHVPKTPLVVDKDHTSYVVLNDGLNTCTPISGLPWQKIETAPKNQFVLLARRSGYVSYEWNYEVGQFTEGYHDRWDTIGNDAIEPQPEYWCPLPNAPEWTGLDTAEVPPVVDPQDKWD